MREPITPIEDLFGGQTWDVFLSHASEDKEAVAVPLRDALTARGVTVWLDKTEMRIGDSLRRKIDAGIRASRMGIVVLSDSIFSKGWTNHELDGLVTRTVAGEQSLLPIWHGVDVSDVRHYSGSRADKVALSTADVDIEQIGDTSTVENKRWMEQLGIPITSAGCGIRCRMARRHLGGHPSASLVPPTASPSRVRTSWRACAASRRPHSQKQRCSR
jgi:hypothetical protein